MLVVDHFLWSHPKENIKLSKKKKRLVKKKIPSFQKKAFKRNSICNLVKKNQNCFQNIAGQTRNTKLSKKYKKTG